MFLWTKMIEQPNAVFLLCLLWTSSTYMVIFISTHVRRWDGICQWKFYPWFAIGSLVIARALLNYWLSHVISRRYWIDDLKISKTYWNMGIRGKMANEFLPRSSNTCPAPWTIYISFSAHISRVTPARFTSPLRRCWTGYSIFVPGRFI